MVAHILHSAAAAAVAAAARMRGNICAKAAVERLTLEAELYLQLRRHASARQVSPQ